MAVSDFKAPVIRVYAGEVARSWTGFGAVEVAFDRHGPARARIVLPRLVAGDPNPLLTAGALFPQGEGVLVEVDARALGSNERGATVGTPDVWLGRVTDPEVGDGASADATISANGPWVDLEAHTTPMGAVPAHGPAGAIAAELIRAYPVDLRIDVGAVHRGKPTRAPVDGNTVRGMLEQLAADSGEECTLVPIPGRARCRMDWMDALSPPDLTGAVGGPAVAIFDDGLRQNARVSLTYTFTRARTELVAAGAAWDRGGPLAVRATTDTSALGRQAALEAMVSTTVVQRFTDGAANVYRPDLSVLPALEAATVTALRRAMRPALAFQAEILDTGLWRYMRPLNLVLMRLPNEATGLYAAAIGQIRTATFSVTPPLACQVSGELWAVNP